MQHRPEQEHDSWIALVDRPQCVDAHEYKRPAYMRNCLDAFQEQVLTEIMPHIESNSSLKKRIMGSLRAHIMKAYKLIDAPNQGDWEAEWKAWNERLHPQEILDQAVIIAETEVCGFAGAGEHLPPGIFEWLIDVFPEDFDNAARAEAICKRINDTSDDDDY